MKQIASTVLLGSLAILAGCSNANNLLLGEVRALVGTHDITVTDCYRLSVDPPRTTAAGFEYAPCRDARINSSRGTAGKWIVVRSFAPR